MTETTTTIDGPTIPPSAPIRLAIIVGSNREGRFGDTVAAWFAGRAGRRADLDVDVIDVAELELPATFPNRRPRALDGFVARLGAADAFVVVTPEYNHGYPAGLKQAIDLVHDEWKRKPVGFVSYGGLAGGLRAVEQLRQVFAELHAVTVRDTVSFHMAHGRFDGDGAPIEPDACNAAAETLLDELVWWASALRTARQRTPAMVG